MRFDKERINDCLELMPEYIRKAYDMELWEKIKLSNFIIGYYLQNYTEIGIMFSGGSDSAVLTHLVTSLSPKERVVFIDTHNQFKETKEYFKEFQMKFGLHTTVTRSADENRIEQFKRKYKDDNKKFIEKCCKYHKIDVMNKVIKDFKMDCVFIGLRGIEHEERAKLGIDEDKKTHTRVYPLMFWSDEDVKQYMKMYKIPVNELYDKGYTSLGCEYCTTIIEKNEHERAGRNKDRERIMKKLRSLGYT